MLVVIFLIISFFLGAVPFGFLTAYLVKGVDIRKIGSGNIGATNVFRAVGKGWGIAVFIFDFLKGAAAVFLMKFFIPQAAGWFFILAAALAVCGHNWTPFLKFKGGKGVATSVGGVAALSFIFAKLGLVLLLSLTVWVLVFSIYRYVSLASILAGGCFFILSLFFCLDLEVKIFSFLLVVFILIRHKSNIKRIITKKELRI